MKIAAVIPAYNVGKYIGRTIESVLAQTRPADEIIVVDDGSTDDTAEKIESFGDKVKLIRQQNAGASVARNTGIEAATSEWIALLDGDDEWLPHHLQNQEHILKNNPDLHWSTANFKFCYCADKTQKNQSDPDAMRTALSDKQYLEEYFQAFINHTTGCTDTIIVKRQILFEAGLFTPDQPMANDLDMWWRIAYLCPRIGCSPEPAAIYHLHVANSITKVHKSPSILADLIEKHIQIAKDHNAYHRFRPCAEHLLRFWIHKYFFDERISEIRPLTDRFPHILPLGYHTILRILTISPRTTTALMPTLQMINRLLRLKV
ncbi:putative glycosyltransferase EpsJ [Anaerohalosphaera lusitana]|uniref:Putative glycosyltransferase EpsJ n=1 Tax=Anaerohalosphaera lusitana TaxID=1936003 RepID=A0A1U9NNY1_9BACT|nr:glycosyltransferase family 2 protein [Anaerohalosphaera lusitana]AQT69623.1 putative glycosyltransferase EpsJ [Anaerohalosphaera lusitana]